MAAGIHIHHRHCYYYSARKLMLILPSSEGRRGGRLSRPRHCIERTQPVPKAVYRSGRRDKHNRPRRDSNVDPLAPQSEVLTTRATATYQVCPPNVPLPVGGIWDPTLHAVSWTTRVRPKSRSAYRFVVVGYNSTHITDGCGVGQRLSFRCMQTIYNC